GVVSMARAKPVADFRIILRARIDVVDQQRDRRAGRHLTICPVVLKHAGNDAHKVWFLALAHVPGSPGAPAVEIGLYIRFDERNPGRTAVDYAADSRSMAFAKGGDAKKMAERVVTHPLAGLTATAMS